MTRIDGVIRERLGALADAAPGRVAVVNDGRTMTFDEFEEEVRLFAGSLDDHGVGPGALVAVAMGRSCSMLVTLHAILRAGAAYLPIDTRWPVRRVEEIVNDSRATHLIFVDEHRRLAASYGPPEIVTADVSVVSTPVAAPVVHSELAYVIYTSGSSGRPKGVAMSHGPPLRTIDWINDNCGVTGDDRILATASAAFDLSVYDFFGPFAAAASVLLATDRQVADPAQLLALLGNNPTLWNSAPAVLDQLLEYAGSRTISHDMRLVMLSGDWIPLGLPKRIRRAFPNAKLLAMGGATEAAIWSNYYWVDEVEPHWKSIPYGFPFPHAKYHVLDEHRKPCAIGCEGDLYIGGDCLADGYLNAPELTSERFLADPFAVRAGARMYATGDRARQSFDGTLEFLGRRDEQVKIRGYRVDLIEIERAIAAHALVDHAVVIAANRNSPSSTLAAYVVPAGETTAPLRRLLGLERSGELRRDDVVDVGEGCAVAASSAAEARFMFKEMFVEDCYDLGAERGRLRVVVDVGANVGMFALAIAHQNPVERIICVEPISQLARLARLNANIHAIPARVVEAALHHTSGRAAISYYPHLSLLSRLNADAEADAALVEQFLRNQYKDRVQDISPENVAQLVARALTITEASVTQMRLSELYAAERLHSVDLLKVNVQGAEAAIFAGLDDQDLAITDRIVVETHDNESRELLFNRFERAGFDCTVAPHDCLVGSGVYMLRAMRRSREEATVSFTPPRTISSKQALSAQLEALLADTLPPHMIPRRWTFVESLFLTANGKVDRRRFEELASIPPLLSAANGNDRTSTNAAVADSAISATVQSIADVWKEVLGIHEFRLDDNFFQLGGDSLKVMQVVSRLRERLGRPISMRHAFECATIADLATAIETKS